MGLRSGNTTIILEETGESGSDREEYLEDLYVEIQKENKEIKAKIKENEELTSQIRTMAGFIERSNAESTQPIAVKTRADATAALAEADKHEEDLEDKVTERPSANLNYLKGRKLRKNRARKTNSRCKNIRK